MLLDYLQDIMKCQQNLYWVELYMYKPLYDALKVKTKFHDISIRTYVIIYLALYNVVIMKVIENAAKLKCFFHPLPSYAKKTSLKHHNRFICRLWNIHFICFPRNKKKLFDSSPQKILMFYCCVKTWHGNNISKVEKYKVAPSK